jgi:hypothetical protein
MKYIEGNYDDLLVIQEIDSCFLNQIIKRSDSSVKDCFSSPAKSASKCLGVSYFSCKNTFGFMPIKPGVVVTKLFPECYFSRDMSL